MRKWPVLGLVLATLLTSKPLSAIDYLRSCLAEDVVGEQPDSTGEIYVDADSWQWSAERGELLLEGNVNLRQGSTELKADIVRYWQGKSEAQAGGHVWVRNRGYEVTAEKVNYHIEGGLIEITKPSEFRLIEHGGSGNTETAEIREEEPSRFTDVVYSTCPPKQRAWTLTAKELRVDKATNTGTAYKARLKLGRMTVFGASKFSFPLSDEGRKSGVLTPRLRNSTGTGLEITVPYYFNLAPNYDATIYPRITSKRGLVLGGEFRYLTEQHGGIVEGEVVPADNEYQGGENIRYAGRWRHRASFTPHLSSVLDISTVSDVGYVNDFGNHLRIASERYSRRFARIDYRESYWDASVRMLDYEAIEEGVSTPYSLLPEIAFNWKRVHYGAFYTELQANYANFNIDRSDVPQGSRFDLMPAVGLDILRPWGFFKTRLSGRYTEYQLDRTGSDPRIDISSDRQTTTGTVDTGLVFERKTHLFGLDMLQTIEPRLYYTYTPYKSQDALPVFDSLEAEFSFDNLFRENRFAGVDRVGDANQLVAALTTRLIDQQSGHERLRASIGQIQYFDDRSVTLPGETIAQTNESALVAELYAEIGRLWSVETAVQIYRGDMEKSFFGVNYHDRNNGRYLSLGWRQRRDVPTGRNELNYTTLSLRWPISERLRLVGGMQYSFENSRTMDVIAGVEYDSCCWALRGLVTRRAADYVTSGRLVRGYEEGAYLQLVLKGFGGLETGGYDNRITPHVTPHQLFESLFID